MLVETVSMCAYHGCPLPRREFVPKRRGQPFCSNECSGKQRKEELEKKLADEAGDVETKDDCFHRCNEG